MKYGLPAKSINKIIEVLHHFPEIEEALLYGSRAKGNYKPASDIDLVIKGEKLSLDILSKVSNSLDDLMMPHKFDLSIYHQISNQELLDHIKRVGSVLYQSEIVS